MQRILERINEITGKASYTESGVKRTPGKGSFQLLLSAGGWGVGEMKPTKHPFENGT